MSSYHEFLHRKAIIYQGTGIHVKPDAIHPFLHERNMTQTELANKLGVQPSYVSMIISGDRAVSDAFRWRWMQVFGAEAVRVLNGDGHTQEAQP